MLKKFCLIVCLIPLCSQANTPSILLKKDTPPAKKTQLAGGIARLSLSAALLTAAYIVHNSSDARAQGSFVDKLPIVAIGLANYMNKTVPTTKYIWGLAGVTFAASGIAKFIE